jgi:hypothetical protein
MYASVEDVEKRCRRSLSDEEKKLCEALLEDAAIIVDAYGKDADEDAKQVVSCNMVIRAIGSGEDDGTPIGASQGSLSALGYSQSWTLSSGSVGELYLTKMDKKLLGVGNRVGMYSPLEDMTNA